MKAVWRLTDGEKVGITGECCDSDQYASDQYGSNSPGGGIKSDKWALQV